MRLKSVVFCLFFALSANTFVEALNSSDPGVCEVKISERKTRAKLVSLNKKCGKKKCVVKKIETYTVPEKRILCCKGWEYDAKLDKCWPICSTGCEGGKCTAPEECTCDPPAYIDPEKRNLCIQPKCVPPCINGHCLANNTCQCNPDFHPQNSTHCTKCDNGYQLVDKVCQPICDKDCPSNAYCSEPNVCSCKDGFSIQNFTCLPQCDCVNAKCVAPNICECLEGYLKLNERICEPQCDDCFGDCVGPNVCKCAKGFKDVDGKCIPEVKCVNGHFSELSVCVCEAGYVSNGTNSNICVRDCSQPEIKFELFAFPSLICNNCRI